MPTLILSAVLSSFTFVRLFKGPWARNPQYLAAAMIGSAVVSLIGEGYFPGSGDDFLTANLLACVGSAAGIFLFGVIAG